MDLSSAIALDAYPEKPEVRTSGLERALARMSGALAPRGGKQSARLRPIIGLIEQHGESLLAKSDDELTQFANDLRRWLRMDGLTDALGALAFALVRERSDRTLGMRHFHVQLTGGWVMLRGMLAEMETGEGKTLTATLPACTAALAGIPVHVVSSNDYLVQRDAELMLPVYRALGLSVGTIVAGMDAAARRAAYACDVTYCSNKELVFDYLKDRLVLRNSSSRLQLKVEQLHDQDPRVNRLLMRGLCFAIVDEADSVLVDEARTPLILSRPGKCVHQTETYTQALDLAAGLQPEADFILDGKHHNVDLTTSGLARLDELARPLDGFWTGTRRRQALVRQALAAQHLYLKDKHYLVRDGKVQIIDEHTGRVMPDRSWERGLHQMIETKEGCEITATNETLAKISYQKFFRRYLHLAGMSGTLREITGELRAVHGLTVVKVPTHKPNKRIMYPTRVYGRAAAKWEAVIANIREQHENGRPVLVGTRSVAASEHLSKVLGENGLKHHLLNARQDTQEAEIVARAGEAGRITLATNMAGRGTDIKLGASVAARGGLHVIITEKNDARRIDRQLAGRCARQGDPGSVACLLSLEDELVEAFLPKSLVALVANIGVTKLRLAGWLGKVLMELPQRSAERHHGRLRQELLKMDEHQQDLMAFAGRME